MTPRLAAVTQTQTRKAVLEKPRRVRNQGQVQALNLDLDLIVTPKIEKEHPRSLQRRDQEVIRPPKTKRRDQRRDPTLEVVARHEEATETCQTLSKNPSKRTEKNLLG